jgi:hypothetical protein
MLLVPIVAMLGVATEASGWYFTQGSLQNAADAAALAAAANITSSGATTPTNCTSPGDPCYEAKAVTAQYGYADGANNVSVTTTPNVLCPGGSTSTCYRVTITKLFPIRLLAVTGYRGDTQVGSARYQAVSATAVTGKNPAGARPYCLLALSTTGTALQTSGNPKADLSGCNVMSNSNATCNGHDLGADVGDAHGTNNGCGDVQNSNVPVVTDPYASLKSNIPSDPCGGVYARAAKKNDKSQQWLNAVPTTPLCGDQKLMGPVTINTNSTLVIYNGQLDLNGNTLKTAAGVSATIVFTSTSSQTGNSHIPVGGGTLDIVAPTSGVWSGIAIYQSPDIPDGYDISEAGNTPTWNITGIVYLPNSDVTFKGAVNKSNNGNSCFGLVANTITVKGTGFSLAHGECGLAGVTLPSSNTGRMVLLQ